MLRHLTAAAIVRSLNARLRLGVGVVALAAAAGIAAPAMAQSITSEVRGRITNPDGQPIVGAQITLVDERKNATKVANTNNQGYYDIRNLETGGPYTLTVTAPNYQSQRVEGLFTSVGAPLSIDLPLIAAGAGIEELLVLGTREVVTEVAIGPSARFNLESLESLPSISRDFRDTIRIDPRIRTDGGGVQCAGSNNRLNSFTIDGVRNQDGFGLNGSGFANRDAQPLPFDAQREVSVEFAPFDVEYGSFTGCNINVVTKSGSNDFSGSAFAVFTSNSLTGNQLETQDVTGAPFRNYNWGATLGGPVIEDKIFFFVAYEETDFASVAGTGPLGGGFAQEQNFITVAEAERIAGLIEARGIPTGGIARNLPDQSRRILTRWDWNITEEHRLAFTYNRLRELDGSGDDINFGAQRFAYAGNFQLTGNEFETYSARLFSDWTENFSTELRASRADVIDIQGPFGGGEAQTGSPIPRIIIGVSNDANGNGTIDGGESGAVVAGPGTSRSANDLQYQTDQIKFKADYRIGRHTVTAGYELDQLDVFNLFAQNATGSIFFPTLNAFLAGQASTGGNAFPVASNPTGTQVFAAGAVPIGNVVGFTGQGSFSGNINDAAAQFSRSIHTFYLQDEWEATDNLTVLLGLRYDRFFSGDGPTFNPNFFDRYGFDNTFGFSGLDVFLPRLGLTYAYDDAPLGPMTFRGGVGVFSGGDPTVWFSNAFSNNGRNLGFGQSNTRSGATVVPTAPCTAADLQFGTSGPITLPDCLVQQQINSASQFQGRVDATDPDFDVPSVVRFNVGMNWTTDFGGYAGGFFDDWTVQVDVIHSRGRNGVAFVDLSLQQTGTAADGRPIFDNVDPQRAGCNATFNGIRSGFSNVSPACFSGLAADSNDILLTNGDSPVATTLSVQFARDFEYTMPGLGLPGSTSLSFGYGFNDSEDANVGTGAVSISSFQGTAALDFNSIRRETSGFETRHTVTSSLRIKQEFIPDLDTSFNFIFVGRSGSPFSYVFDDNVFGPDSGFDRSLLYVPTGPNDPLVQFAPRNATNTAGFGPAQIEAFFQFLEDSGLSEYAGGVAPRNAFRSPWFNDLDFRFAQEIPTPIEGHEAEFYIDIENMLNLIDNSLNIQRAFANNEEPIDVSNVNVNGRQVFRFDNFVPGQVVTTRNIGTSRWAVQLGFKYSF